MSALRESGERTPLLRATDVTKSFAGSTVLRDVSLEVAEGEIVAVVGQNGSGKSTFVKVLAGVHEMDSGRIEVLGADGEILTGRRAQDEVHFIHQDLGLIPQLTAVENLTLGRSFRSRALMPNKNRVERRHALELIRRFGTEFDVTVPVGRLAAAEQTIVAIVRALDGWTRPNNLLVLDEPTAALHGEDVAVLFEAMRRVAEGGAGVLFISHRLDEVLGVSDRVVALRDGQVVADDRTAHLDQESLIQRIVGREVAERQLSARAIGPEPILRVEGVSGGRVAEVDLSLRRGEVVGVSGLLGSGREDLAPVLFGALPRTGRVFLDGRQLAPGRPQRSLQAGLALVPADRRGTGVIMTVCMRENLTLPMLAPLRRGPGWISGRAEREEVRTWISSVDIRPPEPERTLERFSGGNQQKIVLARCLRMQPKVLLLDEPTQGVDVGAKAAIYDLIGRAAADGCAILVCSSDAKELRTLCNRVLVMRGGRVAVELAGDALTEHQMLVEETAVTADLGGHRSEESGRGI